MNDSLLLVESPWVTRRVLKTTDHREEFKNTEGQNYDQDLKYYDKEVEQINCDELHSDWGRTRGEVANGQSEDCLSYCSSIYTLYKYVLVWHNQRINEVDQPMRIKNGMAPFPDGAILAE